MTVACDNIEQHVGSTLKVGLATTTYLHAHADLAQAFKLQRTMEWISSMLG